MPATRVSQPCKRGHGVNRYPNGTCRDCAKIMKRRNYVANRERILLVNWQYRNMNPDIVHSRNLGRYGITPEQFNNLLEKQKGCCAVCNEPKPLMIDHDHTTGVVRGLLCRKCNSGIGMLCDSPERLNRAAEYVRQHARD